MFYTVLAALALILGACDSNSPSGGEAGPVVGEPGRDRGTGADGDHNDENADDVPIDTQPFGEPPDRAEHDSSQVESGGTDPDGANAWRPRQEANVSVAPAGYTGQPEYDADSCGFDDDAPESWDLAECRFFETVDAVIAGLIVGVEPVHEPRSPRPGQPDDMCDSWEASLRVTIEVEASTLRELEGQTVEVWLGSLFISNMGCDTGTSIRPNSDFAVSCDGSVPSFVGSRPIVGISRGDVAHPWFGDGEVGMLYSGGEGRPLTFHQHSCNVWPDHIVDWASLMSAREACPTLSGYRERVLQNRARMEEEGIMYGPRCGGPIGPYRAPCRAHSDCPGDQRCHRDDHCGSLDGARSSCIDDGSCPEGEQCLLLTGICMVDLPGER